MKDREPCGCVWDGRRYVKLCHRHDAVTTLPCGCKSNDTRWTDLCDAHWAHWVSKRKAPDDSLAAYL